ncbi:MAG: hypothetical protein JRK53_04800 [Deltaproteobacteria bacterium]|nr:hypothetical protein [Deltaproteobacteria bacterium]
MGFYKARYRKIMVLVAVILLASGSLVYGEEGIAGNVDSARVEFSDLSKEPLVVVYYFHRAVRCSICMKIESLTVAAVEMKFAQELEEGKVRIKILNMEEDQNSHFETDYQLSAQSVIISEVSESGEMKWKNLDKIWEYVHDEDMFIDYIKSEVAAYL